MYALIYDEKSTGRLFAFGKPWSRPVGHRQPIDSQACRAPGTENGYEHYPIDMYLISGIWHLWRQSNLFDSVVPDDTAAHAAPTFIRYGGRIAAGALSIGL
jgi:hypothetical protein